MKSLAKHFGLAVGP